MRDVQHPSVYFCNIQMKQWQHTSKTSETLETNAYNMRFHRNISLLRSRIAAPMVPTAATTFWWGTLALVAPQQHLGVRAGDGAQCAAMGVQHSVSWSERGEGWSAAQRCRGHGDG
jgi:hypothetical protein